MMYLAQTIYGVRVENNAKRVFHGKHSALGEQEPEAGRTPVPRNSGVGHGLGAQLGGPR